MRSRTQAGYTIVLLAAVVATACNPDRIVTTPGSSGSMETPVYSAGGVPNAQQEAARDAVLAGNATAVAAAPALFPPGAASLIT